MAQNEKEQNDYRITYYNAVSSKEVDWLWYPYIPYGKITILQGDPGEGKSTMMMQLAALITTGKAIRRQKMELKIQSSHDWKRQVQIVVELHFWNSRMKNQYY